MIRGDEEISPFPDPAVQTIVAAAHRAKALWGSRDALVDGAGRVSFEGYVDGAMEIARGLVAAGIGRGDRVAVWLPNSANTAIVILGVHLSGGVLVPVNTRFRAREAWATISDASAKIVVTVDEFLGVRYASALEGLIAELGVEQQAPRVVLAEVGGAGSLNELIAVGRKLAPEATEPEAVGPDDIATILFTSGTTGRPKGVMLRHGALVQAYWQYSSIIGVRAGDRMLLTNPMFHAFGLKVGLLSALLHGAAVHPMAVFNAGDALAMIERESITYYPGPPTVYQSLIEHPERRERDISSLRVAVTGATAIPSQLIHDLYDVLGFTEVHICYGFTEGTGVATITRSGDSFDVISATAGRAVPDVTVAVLREDGSHADPGEVGAIAVAGYNVTPGYIDPTTGDSRRADEGGWLMVGDVGVLDAEGNLTIRGRTRDMLIVGGFNVYPAEIEGYLVEHPDVVEAAVVSRPDARLGEVAHAFIVLRHESAVTAEKLHDWSRDRMANYKVPRGFTFLDALPTNATGKVIKQDLQALVAGWDPPLREKHDERG